MTETERTLLDNALDALDRLFDSKSEVIDAYVLIYATAQALNGSRFFSKFDRAAVQLRTIVRANPPREEAREMALAATNELRHVIADAVHLP
jgi:hypothetical protein